MSTVTLSNVTNVVVLSAIVENKLQLSVGGTVFSTLIDEFDPTPQPPATMRLNVMYPRDGTVVTMMWQPWAGGPWSTFIPNGAGTGSYFDFPVPSAGVSDDIKLQGSTPVTPAVNPKLVLRTKTSSD